MTESMAGGASGRGAALGTIVRRHMPVLDGWRGLAILVVVVHNTGYVAHPGGVLGSLYWTATDAGWVGVSLFFVLSGFLITGILLDTRGRPDYFRSFYVRRTLRIFPLYYGFLVVALLVAPAGGLGRFFIQPAAGDDVWYWLYLSNWLPLLESTTPSLPHLWSLAVEEQFYLVWPFLVALASRRLLPCLIAIVAVSLGSRCVMYALGSSPEHLYTFTNARMDALAIGAVLAVVVRDEGLTARADRFLAPVAATVGVLLLGMMLTGPGFNGKSAEAVLVGQTLVGLAFAVGIFATLSPTGTLTKRLTAMLEIPALRHLGRYSYAVYLFHVPLHVGFGPPASAIIEGSSPVAATLCVMAYSAVVLACSVVLAIASWYLFEVRFLKLKDRLAPREA